MIFGHRAFGRGAVLCNVGKKGAVMLFVFGLPEQTKASELYEVYLDHRKHVDAMPISAALKEAFHSILNQAYEEALTMTEEVLEAAKSPRSAPSGH